MIKKSIKIEILIKKSIKIEILNKNRNLDQNTRNCWQSRSESWKQFFNSISNTLVDILLFLTIFSSSTGHERAGRPGGYY